VERSITERDHLRGHRTPAADCSTVDTTRPEGNIVSTTTAGRTHTRVNPSALAFGAFAGTTFLLSWVNAGLIDKSALGATAATAWIFGGAIQIAVAFWLLRDDHLFAAVTFGSFGSFWVSFALFTTLYVDKVPAADRGPATALFLVPWAIFSVYMLIGAVKVNVAIVVAFVLVEATLIPGIVGDASGSLTATRIGGWAGIVLSVVVWYIAAAEVINHQFRRTVLPLGRLE
jgi:succinate-acetate transporter protein